MKTKHLRAISVVLLLLVVVTQPALGTKYIPSDTSIGTWDSDTRIYTLTADVYADAYTATQVEEDDLTLDGAGHRITGSEDGHGIYLEGRTGVTVKNLSVEGFVSGITLWYSTGNTLTNNAPSNNITGISLGYASDNTLTDNTVMNNQGGINLANSSNNTVSGNTVELNTWCGIRLFRSSRNMLTDNFVNSNGDYGIQLHTDCDDNTLTGNTVTNHEHGMPLHEADTNTLSNNVVSNNNYEGISFYASSSNAVTGNTANFNGNHGIILTYSHENMVTKNIADHNFNGIRLNLYSSNSTVTNNTASSNSNYGIVLTPYCSYNTVSDNTATNNFTGIGLGSSNDNEICNNNLSGNELALSAYLGQGNSYVNNDLSSSTSWALKISHDSEFELSGNDFTNSINGIALVNMDGASLSNVDLSNIAGGIGVELWGVTNSSFSNIIVSGCEYGMLIWQTSSGNTFHDNTISDNTRGIHISYSSNDNIIYNNNFINNATQAHVDGSSGSIFNLDKPIGGNHWSDWTSPDTDSDGFVDFPYVFTGGQDDLPWADPDGWSCRDPGDMIQELADQVMALNLQHGISNGLDAKLDAALQALEDINENNDIAAINTLEAFINAVEAQRGSKITDADADSLITKAQKIIDCLTST